MVFWYERENDKGRGHEEKWEGLLMDDSEHEDALFESLDEDDVEDVQESEILENLFSLQSMDVPLDLVERLSWDAASQGSTNENEELSELALPLHVPHPVERMSEDSKLHSNGISRPSFSTNESISSRVCQMTCFEPEPEYEKRCKEQRMKGSINNQITEKEEVTLYDVETCCWSPDANSVLSSPDASVSPNLFVTYQPVESTARNKWPIDDVISDCSNDDQDKQQGPVVSALRPRLLPRVPSLAQWRRQKTRTCSGVALPGTPLALSPATLETPLSRPRNQSVENDDDGDFSSDDEGYKPKLHRCRASDTECSDAKYHWRRTKHMSTNFSSHRLSVDVRMGPANMTKRLQEAKDKFNSGLHLLRSGSSISTVMTDESYHESPVCQEIKSAPPGSRREPSIVVGRAPSTSLTSVANPCTIDSNIQHSTRQQQMCAGMFRAAGRLNAVSAEAARKLKSRGFRVIHLPRQKAASETEEEDAEVPSTYPPSASDHCSMHRTSPT